MQTLQLLNLLNFYLGKFSVDTADEKAQKIRALNIAKDFIIPQLGLPSSERTYIFTFVEDQEKYTLPSDFLEPISLAYDETLGFVYSNINKTAEFIYEYPERLNKAPKTSGVVYWGIDYSDGLKRIFVKATNIRSSFIINECDSLDGWQGLNDATNLTLDTTRFKRGSASINFKIDETISGDERATLKYNPLAPINLSSWTNKAVFFVDMYMVNSSGVSSITLKFGSSSTDYWSIAQTQNSDNQPFQSNSWNGIVFAWENAIQIGNPDAKNVNFFQIDIDYNEAQFVSPQYWNIDSLRIFSYDRFVLRYYSHNVVQDGTTGNLKKDLTNDNDIALFAQYDPSLGEFVALYASYMYEGFVNKNLTGAEKLLEFQEGRTITSYMLRYPKRTPIYYRGEIDYPLLRY